MHTRREGEESTGDSSSCLASHLSTLCKGWEERTTGGGLTSSSVRAH
jgi:hypothetical protein